MATGPGIEKIDIQKEVFAKDIERVEELRYQISSKTYDSLRKKRNGKLQASMDIDRQINEMRKEFEAKTARLKQAGFDYLIVNKKQLNDIREKFMQLSNDERDKALEGIGPGAELIDQMENILLKNFNKKMEIARMIISFSSLTGEKNKVIETIEGNQEFTIAELKGNEFDLGKFFNSAEELGYICKNSKGKILICRNEEEEQESQGENRQKEQESSVIIDIPGIQKETNEELPLPSFLQPKQPLPQQQPLPTKTVKVQMPQSKPQAQQVKPRINPQSQSRIQSQPQTQIQPQSQMQPQSQPKIKPLPIPVQPQQTQQIPAPTQEENMEKNDMEALGQEHEKDLKEAEKREKEMREKAWLNVSEMELPEVNERMKKILTNIKMQRWVLGTFKDQAEKDEYSKAQILLTALMKRKRELDVQK